MSYDYSQESFETGTEKTEAPVVETANTNSNEDSIKKINKDIKKLTDSNKEMTKILKLLNKQINVTEKIESKLLDNKKEQKTHLKDYEGLKAHFKAFKESLREEKYFLENTILENKKQIDKLKDELAMQK